ncbi:hypothetical protein H8711_12030, partial [Clostridiaceae bacterium NSJ-31]|nr:hypothetical protein [Ligaoa zhengdingensis]
KASALTVAMSKVRLAKVIETREAEIDATKYTAASIEELEAVIAEAKELLESDELTLEQEVEMTNKLNAVKLEPIEKPSKPSSSKGGSTGQVADSDYWTEVIEKINGTEKGGKVNAKLDEGAMVPATVIDALKNKGVTVIFEIGDKDYAVNGAGELKGYSAAAVYYTSDEIKAMAGGAPAASGTVNAPAANSNPETGGEVPTAVAPAAPEATVPVEPVVPEAPAVIEPVVPAVPEAPAAQAEAAVEENNNSFVIGALIVLALLAAAAVTVVVIRRRQHELEK